MPGRLGSKSTNLVSMSVTVSRSAIVSASRSNTVMNGGIWSSYTLRSVTEGMFWWWAVGAVNLARYFEASCGLAACVEGDVSSIRSGR